MSGSLEWVTCPVCEYERACVDSEEKIYCMDCGYASEHGLVFHFLYRKEIRITVIADDLEVAYLKAQTGLWADTKPMEVLHYDMLEEVD